MWFIFALHMRTRSLYLKCFLLEGHRVAISFPESSFAWLRLWERDRSGTCYLSCSPLETRSFQGIASLDLNFSLRCFHNETMGKLATLELAEVSLRLEKHISKCRRSLSMIWFKFNYETGRSFVVEAGCLFLLEWIDQPFALLSISICSK